MQATILLTAAVFLRLAGPAAATSSAQAAPIEISGFGDFYIVTNAGEGETTYQVRQMEVDLETALDEKVGIAAAIAQEDGSFVLGSFSIDLHLLGTGEDHFLTVGGIRHAGIRAGQFDVPFGIDWHVYPSMDRKLVSVPLVVDNTHKGWNDFGLQAYVETTWLDAVAYATNGVHCEGTLDLPETPEHGTEMALGGRVGIKPHDTVEIGVSWAGAVHDVGPLDRCMLGGDVQFGLAQVSIKGEYIVQQIEPAVIRAGRRGGFYGQVTYDFGRKYVVARYGGFRPGAHDQQELSRMSLGAGWMILDGCELRFEYQVDPRDAEQRSFTQMVVSF